MNETQICPRCGGQRTAPGRIGGVSLPIRFRLDETRFLRLGFPFLTNVSALSLTRGFACMDCGLVWTFVSTLDLQMIVETWGNDELKARLLDSDEGESCED